MDFSILLQFLEHFHILFSWKFIFLADFFSFVFLILLLIQPVNDILKSMYNNIIIFCIFTTLLTGAKIIYEIFNFALKKWKENIKSEFEQHEEKQKNEQEEKRILFLLNSLSESEISKFKFFLDCFNFSAWVPDNDVDINNMCQKGLIKQISHATKFLENAIPFYSNTFGVAFYIPENIFNIFQKYHSFLDEKWGHVTQNKILSLFQ